MVTPPVTPHVRSFEPTDTAALRDWVEVRRAVAAADAPWEHPYTEASARASLVHGWDGEPHVPYLATVDGVPVGAGDVGVSHRDNLHLAWLGVYVHPDHRRRGHGRALLRRLEAEAAAQGRTVVGVACWDAPDGGAEAFALAHGYEQKAIGVNRRQHLAEVAAAAVDALHADAAQPADGYELVRWPTRSDDADLDALAELTSAINDAPKEGLDYDDEVFDGARVRAYEDARAGSDQTLYRLVARHTADDGLAGQTVVVVERERPHLAEQHDTSVARGHRGHRLGALLKSGMLQWLREVEPQVTEIDTWNAESNGFMIGVNEELGYRVMGRSLEFQRRL